MIIAIYKDKDDFEDGVDSYFEFIDCPKIAEMIEKHLYHGCYIEEILEKGLK